MVDRWVIIKNSVPRNIPIVIIDLISSYAREFANKSHILTSIENSKYNAQRMSVFCITILSDDLVVVGLSHGSMKIINIKNGECVHTFQDFYNWNVLSIAIFSKTLTPGLIISGSGNGALKIRNSGSGKCIKTIINAHDDAIKCIHVIPDKNVIITGSHDATIKIWTDPSIYPSVGQRLPGNAMVDKRSPGDVITNQLTEFNINKITVVAILEGHRRKVNCIAVLQSKHHIVSGSDDNTLKIWNIDTYTCEKTLQLDGMAIQCISLNHCGQIVSGSRGGNIIICDPLQKYSHAVYTVKNDSIKCVDVLFDGSVVIDSENCELKILDLSQKTKNKTKLKHSSDYVLHPLDYVLCTTPLPDGRVIGGTSYGLIKMWK